MNKSDLKFLNSFVGKHLKGASDTPLTFELTNEVYNGLSDKTFNDLEDFYNEEWSLMDVDTAIEFVQNLGLEEESEQTELDNLRFIRGQNSEAVIGFYAYTGFYAMNIDDYLDLLARFAGYAQPRHNEKVL